MRKIIGLFKIFIRPLFSLIGIKIRIIPVGLEVYHYEHPDDAKMISVIKNYNWRKKAKEQIYEEFSKETSNLLADSLKVTKSSYPKIYKLINKTSKILNVSIPEVYIQHELITEKNGQTITQSMNAVTNGTKDGYFILLTSGLIDKMTKNELLFVLGHEMGHIKSEHVLFQKIVEIEKQSNLLDDIVSVIGMATLGWIIPGPWSIPMGLSAAIGSIIKRFVRKDELQQLCEWYPKSEFTADRAGLIVCQDVNDACRALIKLHSGLKDIPKSLTPNEFLKQKEKIERNQLSKELISEAEKSETHPFLVNRIKELVDFSQSKQYKQIVNGVDLRKIK